MPRAKRYFLPSHVWHITHPSGDEFQSFQSFNRFAPFKPLRRFKSSRFKSSRKRFTELPLGMRDRRRYLHWIFEAKKRFGLSVLNYMITSNHVHLLIKDTGPNVIADSMQLIAGRTAQEYNQRKDRQGAFWEDRYHATAIDADEHLHRCLIYIDLNMVRAIEY